MLASHNTMSYLKPSKWYLRPFTFISKCQDKNIVEQYILGIRMFDIRVRYDKHSNLIFAHGLMSFKGPTVDEILNIINSLKDCSVRLIFEEYKYNKNTNNHTKLFIKDATYFINKYKNINFFEFKRKYDWEQLINTNYNPKYIQKVASMTTNILNSICPKIYAIFNNKKIVSNISINEYTFIDFVGKYY